MSDGERKRDLNALAPHQTTTLSIEWVRPDRGFLIGRFRDRYGQECSIRESSLAGEYAIWLGADPYWMHLTYEQVRSLAEILQRFVENDGKLEAEGTS